MLFPAVNYNHRWTCTKPHSGVTSAPPKGCWKLCLLACSWVSGCCASAGLQGVNACGVEMPVNVRVLWGRQDAKHTHFGFRLVLCVMRRNPFDWLCSLFLLLCWVKLLILSTLELQNFRRTLEWRIEAISKIIRWLILELHSCDFVKNKIVESGWISSKRSNYNLSCHMFWLMWMRFQKVSDVSLQVYHFPLS